MKRVRKLLFIAGGLVALGFLISSLLRGRIEEIPFAAAAMFIALVNLSRWPVLAREITSFWLIAAAVLATNLLTGRVSILSWIVCGGVLVLYGLEYLETWRSSTS